MTTTRPRGFASWNPKGDTLNIIRRVQDVLEEYSDQLPLTIRQIFYRLVAQHGFEKTEKGYGRLQEYLNRARRAKLIDFDDIRDDGFYQSALSPVQSVEHALQRYRVWARGEELDRQAGQGRPLTVWCEARGMVPMLEGVANEYGIAVMSSGGFDSLTTQHELGRKLAETEGLVLHLGDYDPSGVHMFSSLEENILAFAGAYHGEPVLERIAILPDHIEQYELPTAPPKKTDRRAFSDHRTVQLEAFAPDVLLQLLRTEIENRMDLDIYDEVLDEESGMRQELINRLAQ